VEHFGEPLEFRDLCMDYTVPQDLTGLPVCVIPIGFDSDDLPVGVQVTAPDRREDLAFQVALEISTAINLEKKWPLLESHR
jgi:Asp-tRNA(Asn)/Glu-tRNA(Gln) amidotransferase A subunit family amidase